MTESGWLRILLAPLLALVLWSASAQAAAPAAVSPAHPEAAAWRDTAALAVQLLAQPADDEAAVDRLEKVRADLARQRDRAERISESPGLDLEMLMAELKSLGPPPTADNPEEPWIATRRAELARRIDEGRAPLVAASEAKYRAIVLIKRLDARIRVANERQLLARMPSPLVPGTWTHLPGDFAKAAAALRSALNPAQAVTAASRQSAWPLALLVGVIGLALAVAVQRPVAQRLDRALANAHTKGGAILLLFLRDMASLIIPGMGLFIILAAIVILFPPGPVQAAVVTFAVVAGLMIIFSAWLGRSLFSPQASAHRFVDLSDRDAHRAAWVTLLLGIATTFDLLVESVQKYYDFADGSIAALSLIVIAAIAIGLWHLATILKRHPRPVEAAGDHAFGIRMTIARAIQVIAVVGVAMVASGYVALSREALDPTLMTLATVAIGLLTYRRLTMISSAVIADDIKEQYQSVRLLPVLYGFVIALVCLPLIALFWGVRPTTIGDFIADLRNGFAVGQMRISVGDVFVFILVFTIGYGLTRWIQRLLQTGLFPMLQIDSGVQAALLTGTGYAGLTVAGLLATTSAGLDLSSLAIVAGALSVGVGLGLQGVVANFVSGVILLIERPIKPGDWIEVGGHAGIVEKIAVRSTRIHTAEQDDVIIPNSELIATAVRNRTYGGRSGRIALPVGVAYGTDLDAAAAILREVAESNPAVQRDVPISVLFDEFEDSAVTLKLLCLIDDISQAPIIRSELRFEVFRRFRAAGIEIPFPQREITLKRPSHPGRGKVSPA